MEGFVKCINFMGPLTQFIGKKGLDLPHWPGISICLLAMVTPMKFAEYRAFAATMLPLHHL